MAREEINQASAQRRPGGGAILVYIAFLSFLSAAGVPVLRFLRLYIPHFPGALLFALWLVAPVSFFLGLCIPRGRLKSFLRRLGEGGISLLAYPLMTAVGAEALALILRLFHVVPPLRETGIVCLFLSAAALLYGVPHALRPVTVAYQIQLNRPISPLRLALISDLHMGFFTGRGLLQRIVRSVNALDADAVLIAGDLFDEEYSALRRPDQAMEILAGLTSRFGTFACEGNHDRYCPSPAQEAFFAGAKITMLRDASVTLPGLRIVGRRDWFDDARLHPEALIGGDASDAPIVVLDHNPSDYENVLDAGADLVLCGHTHNGQTFPGNILLRILPGHSYGLKRHGSGCCIVTSGAGIWGLPIKIGVNTEIVLIELVGTSI